MGTQWALVAFTLLTGMGGRLFFFMALDELRGRTRLPRWMCWPVIVLLVGGALASMTHLTHPERALGVMNRPTGSIFSEAALTGAAAVLCTALARRSAERVKLLSATSFASAFLTAAGIRVLMWLVINVNAVTMFALS